MDPRLTELPNGVRIFTDPRIQTAIDSAVAALGSDAKFAAVAHGIYDSNGHRLMTGSFVVRLPAGFSVAVAGYLDFAQGDKGVEGKVIWKG